MVWYRFSFELDVAGRGEGHSRRLALIITLCHRETRQGGSDLPEERGGCRSSVRPTWGAKGREGREGRHSLESLLGEGQGSQSRAQYNLQRAKQAEKGSRDGESEAWRTLCLRRLQGYQGTPAVFLRVFSVALTPTPPPDCPPPTPCHEVLICWKHLSELVQQRRHEGKPPKWGSENPGSTQ